jgi:hypothetical protein
MIAGVEAGHWLAYRIVYRDPYSRAQALAGSGHGYLHYAPPVFAMASAIGVCAFGTCVFGRRDFGRSAARVSLLPFLLLSPLAFALQEIFERLAIGVWPLTAVLAPTFMPGLLFQLPFALAAFLTARWLLRAADRLRVVLFGHLRPKPVAAFETHSSSHFAEVDPLRVPSLASGYGKRGPPAGLVPAVSAVFS